MSHMAHIATEFRDLEALKAACKRLGWEFLEDATSYRWYGLFVGDSPMPEGLTKDDLGRCEHAIRVPGAQYEIGLTRRGDKWAAHWDWYEDGGLDKAMGRTGGPLKQAYAVEKAKIEARKNGHSVTEQRRADGSIRLTIQAGR